MFLGRIALKEAAMLIDPPLLSQLKQEHGGLQTLFRNHHQIFVGEITYTFLVHTILVVLHKLSNLLIHVIMILVSSIYNSTRRLRATS